MPTKKPLQPWAEQMIVSYGLIPLDEEEYFVQWETGRLGVNISEDKETELPYVSKITDATSPLAAAMEVGDFLLCVNELRAEENSFNNFLRLLTTKQKPVLLRFRKSSNAHRMRVIASQEAKIQQASLQRKGSKEEMKSTLRPLSSSEGITSHHSQPPKRYLSDPTNRTDEMVSIPKTPPKSTHSNIPEETHPMQKKSAGSSQIERHAERQPEKQYERQPERQRARSVQEEKNAQRKPSTSAPIEAPPTQSVSTTSSGFVFSWNDGPLGVYFGEDESTQLPIVTRTLPHASPLIIANVNIGDTLVSANGLQSSEHPFGEFFAALQKMTKPIHLVFASELTPLIHSNTPLLEDVANASDVADDETASDSSDDEEARQMYNEREQLDDDEVPKIEDKTETLQLQPRPSSAPRATPVPVLPPPTLLHVLPTPAPELTRQLHHKHDRQNPLPHVPDELPYTSDDDDDDGTSTSSVDTDDDEDTAVITDVDLDLDLEESSEDSEEGEAVMPKLDFPGHHRQLHEPQTTAGDGKVKIHLPAPLLRPIQGTGSNMNNERTGGSRRSRSGGKNKRGNQPVMRLPKLNESEELTIPLLEPNSVNMKLTVRGKLKSQRVSKMDTPDSSMYLVKWKENKSIGVQLRECRLKKGVYPMVVLVCREACCESLRHVRVGDLLVEINGRDTAMMGVKKTISFVKTCTKTALLKFKRGPGMFVTRVSASI